MEGGREREEGESEGGGFIMHPTHTPHFQTHLKDMY